MKRILPICLLIIYLAGTGGIFFGLKIIRYTHFLHMSSELKEDRQKKDIVLLIIDLKETRQLHWRNGQKEIEFQGRMFDVSRYTIKKGIYYIYCYPDAKENQLITASRRSNSLEKKDLNILSKILILPCLAPIQKDCLITSSFTVSYNSNSTPFPSAFLEVISPPPKQIRPV